MFCLKDHAQQGNEILKPVERGEGLEVSLGLMLNPGLFNMFNGYKPANDLILIVNLRSYEP